MKPEPPVTRILTREPPSRPSAAPYERTQRYHAPTPAAGRAGIGPPRRAASRHRPANRASHRAYDPCPARVPYSSTRPGHAARRCLERFGDGSRRDNAGMCGICGLVTSGIVTHSADAQVRAMNSALTHRGPDGEGYYQDEAAPHVRLGMRRL